MAPFVIRVVCRFVAAEGVEGTLLVKLEYLNPVLRFEPGWLTMLTEAVCYRASRRRTAQPRCPVQS